MNKNNDIELFKVVLDEEGQIRIQFSEEIKRNKSAEELETILRDDVQEHLTPIIQKLILAAF